MRIDATRRARQAPGMEFVALILGAAGGGCARQLVGDAVARRAGSRLPWGTLAVNVSGSFALGFLHGAGWTAVDAARLDDAALGFLGGYTTVSAFALQADDLLRRRRRAACAAYSAASVALALAAAFAGCALGRAWAA